MALEEGKSYSQRLLDKGLSQSVQEFKRETLNNRDPKGIHEDVKISFEDIIAEPTGYHSTKYIWHMTKEIYQWGRKIAYEFFSFIFGIPMALFWGCLFAIVACLHVWCYSPLRRSHLIKMNCWSQFWAIIVASCCDPLFNSGGKLFSNVHIETEKIIV